jgi:Outer membrane protein beta-barrel domain
MKYFRFLIFILLSVNSLKAQSRFGGGIVAGFNASQMDGDGTAGFTKVGGNIGLRATVQLTESDKWQLATNMVLSQRGSRSNPNDGGAVWSATLNYLEVPVTMSIRDWKVTDKSGHDFYKVYFTVGLSYGRLYSSVVSPNFTHPQAVVDVFQKNDISGVAGLSYYVNHHWGFNWYYTRSLNYLFNPQKHEGNLASFNALQGYFLTFQTVWMF